MWDAAGRLGLPVFIHIADPDTFIHPVDRFNERYYELQRRPEWSFYGKDFPKKEDLLSATVPWSGFPDDVNVISWRPGHTELATPVQFAPHCAGCCAPLQ